MDTSLDSLVQGASIPMSKRHEIEDHIRTLGEISEIMGAMNSLAMMEIHKLTRLLFRPTAGGYEHGDGGQRLSRFLP